MRILLTLILFLMPISVLAGTATPPVDQAFTGCTQDTSYDADGWVCGTSYVYNNINNACSSPDGHKNQVLSAANYPGGSGRGFRRYFCGGGLYNDTGFFSIGLNSAYHEIWLRFYIRWQTGFTWSPMTWAKIMRFTPISSLLWYDIKPSGVTFTPYSGGGTTPGTTGSTFTINNGGWNDMNPSTGGSSGDDSWHCVEIHILDQSGNDTYDGQIDYWFDGNLKGTLSNFNFNHGAAGGINRLQWFQNQNTPGQNGEYADIDEIKVSTTGRIYPIGGFTQLTPKAPTNLRAN